MMRVSPAERARCACFCANCRESLYLDIGRLQDGRPPGDFDLDEGREPRRRAIGLHWYRSAEIGQTFLDAGVPLHVTTAACFSLESCCRGPWPNGKLARTSSRRVCHGPVV